MEDSNLTQDQEKAVQERTEATNRIIGHKGSKTVVVAGPGTGKTHLFKQLFATKAAGPLLTLTFINALVEDLCLELHGISEVRTLHGYARSIFRGEVKIFPGLPTIIQEDGEILLGVKIDFNEKMNNMDESDGHLEFYSKRRKYYDHFGYPDIVLGLVRFFRSDSNKIPVYAQVVVDEFQDFNKLEVELIEQLSQKSPILIAGDDDQAIYEFKSSSPDFIRALHGDARPEFAAFPLPFCSRSTSVIVGAVNDIITAATQNGHLKGRVDKPYQYFPCPSKDAESAENPTIVYKRLEDKQIPWFVQTEIGKVAETLRKKFDVLVISPYSIQCEKIGNSLRSKGFAAVDFKGKEIEKLPYLDGLRLLAKDRNCNLGWRVVSKALLTKDEFAELLRKTEDCSKRCKSLLPKVLRADVERDLKTLKAIIKGDPVDKDHVSWLLRQLGYSPERVNEDFVKFQFGDKQTEGSCYPGIRKIPITVTTVQGSKGLAADYVFITHFDKRYVEKDGVTNQGICNFLVALTRARRKIWLLSTSDDASPLLNWISAQRIETR